MTPCALSEVPIMQRAATLANCKPQALETNGTVLDARGFTSNTNTVFPWIANCTFIKPTTPKARAICLV